jgi:hypothetical protein
MSGWPVPRRCPVPLACRARLIADIEQGHYFQEARRLLLDRRHPVEAIAPTGTGLVGLVENVDEPNRPGAAPALETPAGRSSPASYSYVRTLKGFLSRAREAHVLDRATRVHEQRAGPPPGTGGQVTDNCHPDLGHARPRPIQRNPHASTLQPLAATRPSNLRTGDSVQRSRQPAEAALPRSLRPAAQAHPGDQRRPSRSVSCVIFQHPFSMPGSVNPEGRRRARR